MLHMCTEICASDSELDSQTALQNWIKNEVKLALYMHTCNVPRCPGLASAALTSHSE